MKSSMIRIQTFKQNKNKNAQNTCIFQLKKMESLNDESKLSAGKSSEESPTVKFPIKIKPIRKYENEWNDGEVSELTAGKKKLFM